MGRKKRKKPKKPKQAKTPKRKKASGDPVRLPAYDHMECCAFLLGGLLTFATGIAVKEAGLYPIGDEVFGIAFGGGVLLSLWFNRSHVVLDPGRDEVRLRKGLTFRTLPLSSFHTLVHRRTLDRFVGPDRSDEFVNRVPVPNAVHDLYLEGDDRTVHLCKSKTGSSASPEHYDAPAIAKQLGLKYELRDRDVPWWHAWRWLD